MDQKRDRSRHLGISKKFKDHHHAIKIGQVMTGPSLEKFGNFKNCALSKFKILGQWLNFLDFKHLL